MAGKTKAVVVGWSGDLEFTALAQDGSTVRMSPQGFTPMDFLLLGLAGCTGMDVIDILRKKRQQVTALELRVSGEQAADYPMKFTHINVTYVVTGHRVDPEAVRRAIELSETKYCSVAATLRGVAQIETAFEVHEAARDTEN